MTNETKIGPDYPVLGYSAFIEYRFYHDYTVHGYGKIVRVTNRTFDVQFVNATNGKTMRKTFGWTKGDRVNYEYGMAGENDKFIAYLRAF